MKTRDAAQLLMGGPRGRELCLAVSGADVFEVITSTYLAEKCPELSQGSKEIVWLSGPLLTVSTPAALAEAIGEQPLVAGADLAEDALLKTLAEVVSGAAYWQPPDDDETACTDLAVIDALTPTAAAVSVAPGASWWDRHLVPADQHFVSWIDDPEASRAMPPPLTGAAERLARWRNSAQRAGSVWWSTPNRWDVVSTSPSFGALPALQLALVEDPVGMNRARVARLRPPPNPRIYEITDPPAWVALVEAYPLDAGASRAQAWGALTGRRSRWLIPDWWKVADTYDGVHLTVLAYLATAGRALPALDGTTVLAGWEPDTTFWLTDNLTQAEEPATWIAIDPTGSLTAWRKP